MNSRWSQSDVSKLVLVLYKFPSFPVKWITYIQGSLNEQSVGAKWRVEASTSTYGTTVQSTEYRLRYVCGVLLAPPEWSEWPRLQEWQITLRPDRTPTTVYIRWCTVQCTVYCSCSTYRTLYNVHYSTVLVLCQKYLNLLYSCFFPCNTVQYISFSGPW